MSTHRFLSTRQALMFLCIIGGAAVVGFSSGRMIWPIIAQYFGVPY